MEFFNMRLRLPTSRKIITKKTRQSLEFRQFSRNQMNIKKKFNSIPRWKRYKIECK